MRKLLYLLLALSLIGGSLVVAGAAAGALAATPNAAEPSVKVIAPSNALDQRQAGVELWHDYGAFALYRVRLETLNTLAAAQRSQVVVVDDTILLDAAPFNPLQGEPVIPAAWRLTASSGGSLGLIQFVGPLKAEWIEAVKAAGVVPVHPIANHAYLVWADGAGRQSLAGLVSAGDFLQYSGLYQPSFKLGPSLRERLLKTESDPDELVTVTVQMYRHAGRAATEQVVAQVAVRQETAWQPILAYQNMRLQLRVADVARLAQQPDVYWIGEWHERELLDEVQNQIMAGNFDGDQTGPSGPGYKAWLDSLGFSTNPNDYPIVDITDDGIAGNTAPTVPNNPTLDTSLDSRIAYRISCHANYANDGRSPDGHGHINASIALGLDLRTGSPYQDENGFQRGLGINPYGRGGGTRIFGGNYNISLCGGTDTGVIAATYQAGGRISSNSWGCSGCAGTYDDGSQAYDVGTRDADLTSPGNQELITLFAAGNSGPGSATVGTPGNGKNMITVGASENDRPTWTDGCDVDPTGANNAMDVIDFSSRGPSPGGRTKPEVIAPGTHIQGTATNHPSPVRDGTCDAFFPTGQTVYAASSGTSHSTPAVAGAASLYYWWLQNHHGIGMPSPALMKAYLMGHTTYLTGVDANDTLPSNKQGYGMPNMKVAFDATPRYLVNQTVRLDNTGQVWTFSGAVADPSKPVRIVLAYTDAAGAIGTSPQVNNLNLAATVGGQSYLGNVFNGRWSTTGGAADILNNYEAIFLPAGASGVLEVTITAANILGDGVPNVGDDTDQDFALVCYNCAQNPDFTLQVAPGLVNVCAPTSAAYSVMVGQILGYDDPVTLSLTGNPAGTMVNFGTNPGTPPFTTSLTIGNMAAAQPGSYPMTILGVAPTSTHTTTLALNVFTSVPGGVTLLTPANDAVDQSAQPAFTWSDATQAYSYTIEIATDPAFSNIVETNNSIVPSYVPAGPLNTSTYYYWRVKAHNTCGVSSYSATFRFATEALPGECGVTSTPLVVYSDDMESGAPGWALGSGGSGNSWTLWGTRTHSGVQAWHANDPTVTSDQRLVSPAIVLPQGLPNLTLQFWNRQSMEDRSGGCYDGGILEVSSDDGTTWSQITTGLQMDPYDGPFTSSNPLGTVSAWCGDPQEWLNSVVDLTPYAGQTVRFRFRLGSDGSVGRDGWEIDDVKVQACSTQPDFLLDVEPEEQAMCVGQTATYTLDIGSVLGFADPITFSATGHPAGATASFSPNPVTPPGTSQLTIGNTAGAASGSYELLITGMAPTSTHTTTLGLEVYAAAPGATTLVAPTNGATGVTARPTFQWVAASGAHSYTLEVASDLAFTHIVATVSDLVTTTHTLATDLGTGATYYWRVKSANACGVVPSTAFSFTVVSLPGDCAPGTVPQVVYSDNMEANAPGWALGAGGTQNSWALWSTRVHSGQFAWNAPDLTTVSDQRLVSPQVVLPSSVVSVTLHFWNYQSFEDRSGGCYDGAILEVSTDDGATWSQAPGSTLMTDPYNGPIGTGHSNPLGGLQAWCGDPQDWLKSVVSLDAYTGQTVRFRFRVGTDTSTGRTPDGWAIDDVAVVACVIDDSTPTPTATATKTPDPAETPTPTATATETGTATVTPETATATASATATGTGTATVTPETATATATATATGTATQTPTVVATHACTMWDVMIDGFINVTDLVMIGGEWNSHGHDMDGDGMTTVADIQFVAAHFGSSCP